MIEIEHAVARNSDPETSHQAAASVVNLPERQQAVLDVLASLGAMTHERLIRDYTGMKQSVSGLRTRCSELVKQGRVRDTGRREKLASGRSAIVWEAV